METTKKEIGSGRQKKERWCEAWWLRHLMDGRREERRNLDWIDEIEKILDRLGRIE